MKNGFEKYIPFKNVDIKNRKWPDNVITKAPIWCSVDLRDGNQALVNPMNLEQKVEFFKLLVDVGFKEIEVGFPSASNTEYEILRELIEGGHIPDDVTIQVLVQCREHLIKRTFEAIKGAKNVILHFYNSTSALQRKVVFHKDKAGITQIAVDAARLIKQMESEVGDTNIRYEYSPESFSGTECDYAVEICDRVIEEIGATPDNKIILNLPSTVECCTPNRFADMIEYFCDNLKHRDSAIISIHPHNDRGTGIATAELSLLAGADRIEGTLFGNGERTGNVDIVTLALNMYSQGVDPHLDFSNINHVKKIYEDATSMKVHERHPYAGKLVFTAFSGSHQDAINKGVQYMRETDSDYWEVPYLPIDPADVGREYEPIIRINSQSGKGGAAFVMRSLGYDLPKKMHVEFGDIIKKACDEAGTELDASQVFKIFEDEYINFTGKYKLIKKSVHEESDESGSKVHFDGTILTPDGEKTISGVGNGPIDAFFTALKSIGISDYEFMSYSEHAISAGADSKAVAYIELKNKEGKSIFGVGIASNINHASLKGIICAINRDLKSKESK